MTQIQEIEQAIAKLLRKEFFELVRNLRERHAREWDQQIEETPKAESSARFIGTSKQDQPEMPLDDFLDDERARWFWIGPHDEYERLIGTR